MGRDGAWQPCGGRGDRSRGGGPSPWAEVGGRRLGKMVGRECLSSLDGLRRRSWGFGGGDVMLFPPPHTCSCACCSGSWLMLLVQERGNFGTPVALALFCRRETVSCNPLYRCDYIRKPQGNWFNSGACALVLFSCWRQSCAPLRRG